MESMFSKSTELPFTAEMMSPAEQSHKTKCICIQRCACREYTVWLLRMMSLYLGAAVVSLQQEMWGQPL